ncbi:MAG: ABC transporter permease [Pedosphaera sp.]|nr:ABC transporter permease [Pedosphaera sp.]
MKPKIHFGEQLSPRGEQVRSALTSGPGIAWVTVFLLVPLLSIIVISFMSRGTYGDVQPHFTLENFKRFLGYGAFGFDPLYPKIILRSLLMALGTVTLCMMVALPLTFFIAGLPQRWKQVALMLVIIPFWTNMLIRTYAWQIIFSGTGWLARAAAALGWIAPGDALYPSALAVFVVLTCDFLPVLALPLYASVEKIDWSIAEAASDLGADGRRVFWHALLPQIKPGLMAGAILVFIPATGQFAIPDLMGGAKTVLLGNAIQQQFGFSRDWPFGSAISCLAMLIVMLGLWVFARTAGEEGRKTLI